MRANNPIIETTDWHQYAAAWQSETFLDAGPYTRDLRYGTIQKTEANERSIRRESGRNRKTEWKRRNPRNRMIPTVSRVPIRAENTRFELVRLLHQHAFQACAIDH